MVKNKTSFILYPYQSSTPYSKFILFYYRIYSMISPYSRRSRRKVNFPKVNSIKRSHGYKSYNFCQVNFLSPPKKLNYNVLKNRFKKRFQFEMLEDAHQWIQSLWSILICPRFYNYYFRLFCPKIGPLQGHWRAVAQVHLQAFNHY